MDENNNDATFTCLPRLQTIAHTNPNPKVTIATYVAFTCLPGLQMTARTNPNIEVIVE